MKRLLLLAVLLGACTSTGSTEPRAATLLPTTTTATSPSTAPPLAEVVVRLSEIEATASAGAVVQVGETIRLTGNEVARTALPHDRPVTLAINYIVDGVTTGPAWTQDVQAVEDGTVELVVEQPWRNPQPVDEPIVMAWQAAGNSEIYLDQLAAAPGLTVTSPIWWSIDENGLLVGDPDPEFVEAAHEMGIDVWPYVSNAFDPIRTRRLLADDTRRSLAAVQLSGQAQLAGADGVNLDFESFSFVDRDNFTAFVEELAGSVHAWGGVVSVDITVRTRNFSTLAESRANLYDRRALAGAADHLVLMAYDEYTTIRPAGPTASHAWTQDAVHWLLRYADPHQILLGIPFYARIWDPEELNRPQAAGIGTIVELAESNPRTYDPGFGVDRVDLEDGRFLWAEDYAHLETRIALARDAGVAGTAAWRLGLDTPEVWPIVAGR